MIHSNICIYDFETGGTNPKKTPVLSIGATILDSSSLEILDEFYSLVKPDDKDIKLIEDKALSVNNLTLAQINEAIPEKIVWSDFFTFVKKYQNGSSVWNCCIQAGFNIASFDMIILDRYCKKYNCYDKKEDRPNLFRPFPIFDVATIVSSWFFFEKEPQKLNLSAIASHLGLDTSGAHNALEDVFLTSKILIRFLKFQRNIMGKYRNKIKGCFEEGLEK